MDRDPHGPGPPRMAPATPQDANFLKYDTEAKHLDRVWITFMGMFVKIMRKGRYRHSMG